MLEPEKSTALFSTLRNTLVYAGFTLALASAGCTTKEKQFESKVQLVKIQPVQLDEKGAAISTDIDLLWTECPGVQRQTVRGGRQFTDCIKKVKAGDKVVAKMLWESDGRGAYDFHVMELAGCEMAEVEGDESSFESVADCTPATEHDAVVGFHCERIGAGELIDKCPWFRRE